MLITRLAEQVISRIKYVFERIHQCQIFDNKFFCLILQFYKMIKCLDRKNLLINTIFS